LLADSEVIGEHRDIIDNIDTYKEISVTSNTAVEYISLEIKT